MPAYFEQLFCTLGGNLSLSSIVFGDWVADMMQLATSPLVLGIVAAGFFGLLTGWLIGKTQRKAPELRVDRGEDLDALTWRHEKLVLTERQNIEKQARISHFVSELKGSGIGKRNALGVSLFELCECIRETRQTVGTDLSRLEILDSELAKRSTDSSGKPEVISACREMAQQQMVQSRKVRDIFQQISKTILPIESSALALSEAPRLSRSDLTVRLGKAKALARKLPPNWEFAANEVDRKIRDLLDTCEGKSWSSLGRILLVDGGVTASREDDSSAHFPAVLERTIAVLNTVSAKPKTQPSSEDTSKLSLNTDSLDPLALKPDNGFMAPSNLSREEMAETRRINPASLPGTPAFEARREAQAQESKSSNGNGLTPSVAREEAGQIGEPGEGPKTQILYRSNDISNWGRNLYRGKNCRARALGKLPVWAKWVSLERADTGERVFASLPRETLLDATETPSFGFNSSNELFYGARHLGLFSESCRNDVETKFTYGGWGYGHRVSGGIETNSSPQALGWAGVEIPIETVVEFAIHSELPETGEKDLVLDHQAAQEKSL